MVIAVDRVGFAGAADLLAAARVAPVVRLFLVDRFFAGVVDALALLREGIVALFYLIDDFCQFFDKALTAMVL